mmetsp:Transcript_27636/g.38160  ORF Transcript_27636/g.38160 Transcript_27636/m.38160 type:complete len:458 (+) Transcript_27636:136-1509(+)|eukprot:CAMPEP_0196598250 /NCGR_PEP_ID=MMETSP1081-20130531/94212_1 /TAXON_ID=36882 /ORGANISM="Pyramimonas amylifera, Strain CCMP720" /LENGTH=457 /DNA_ID=CAMNT_0041923919 /DNA_START=71 /DNA_END=1444 /DNA_ORIENTATION=-
MAHKEGRGAVTIGVLGEEFSASKTLFEKKINSTKNHQTPTKGVSRFGGAKIQAKKVSWQHQLEQRVTSAQKGDLKSLAIIVGITMGTQFALGRLMHKLSGLFRPPSAKPSALTPGTANPDLYPLPMQIPRVHVERVMKSDISPVMSGSVSNNMLSSPLTGAISYTSSPATGMLSPEQANDFPISFMHPSMGRMSSSNTNIEGVHHESFKFSERGSISASDLKFTDSSSGYNVATSDIYSYSGEIASPIQESPECRPKVNLQMEKMSRGSRLSLNNEKPSNPKYLGQLSDRSSDPRRFSEVYRPQGDESFKPEVNDAHRINASQDVIPETALKGILKTQQSPRTPLGRSRLVPALNLTESQVKEGPGATGAQTSKSSRLSTPQRKTTVVPKLNLLEAKSDKEGTARVFSKSARCRTPLKLSTSGNAALLEPSRPWGGDFVPPAHVLRKKSMPSSQVTS